MSLGNTNTNGNKKSNFNFQLRVLQLLSAISGGNSASLTPHSGFTTTVTATGPGTVAAANAYSVVFHNAGGAAAIVNGATLAANASRTYTAAVGKTLPAITYDGSGTSLVIEQLNY